MFHFDVALRVARDYGLRFNTDEDVAKVILAGYEAIVATLPGMQTTPESRAEVLQWQGTNGPTAAMLVHDVIVRVDVGLEGRGTRS